MPKKMVQENAGQNVSEKAKNMAQRMPMNMSKYMRADIPEHISHDITEHAPKYQKICKIKSQDIRHLVGITVSLSFRNYVSCISRAMSCETNVVCFGFLPSSQTIVRKACQHKF